LQSVNTSLELLARFGEQNKIDERTFTRCCLGPIQQLWTFTDRAVRTALLRTLRALLHLLSRETVNKKLFDPLLSGEPFLQDMHVRPDNVFFISHKLYFKL
jgi:hypothetical protein